MSDMTTVGLVGILSVLIILGIVTWMFARRKAAGTPDGEKPAWMRETPPPATVAALKADGEKVAVFDHDPGEKMASAFAEQIEDMVRAQLDADPFLRSTQIDFGTAPDGGIEFHVNGQTFTDLKQMPDGRIKAIIQQAIQTYNQQR